MKYKVVYVQLSPEQLPDPGPGYPSGAHVRQMERIKNGAPIRNPVCFRYEGSRLECIDRPSRIWMAKAANVPLPAFISDFDGIWEGELIVNVEAAKKYIGDPTVWGPRFDADGMRYRAP